MMNLEGVEELTPPFEIFEFRPGVPATFEITAFKIGRMRIAPRWPGAPALKDILAVRIYVKPETKPAFPYYYDITPSRLVHQLAAMLTAGIPSGKKLRITRDVAGPKAHFTIEWV